MAIPAAAVPASAPMLDRKLSRADWARCTAARDASVHTQIKNEGADTDVGTRVIGGRGVQPGGSTAPVLIVMHCG